MNFHQEQEHSKILASFMANPKPFISPDRLYAAAVALREIMKFVSPSEKQRLADYFRVCPA
jgi:hypothetical protein